MNKSAQFDVTHISLNSLFFIVVVTTNAVAVFIRFNFRSLSRVRVLLVGFTLISAFVAMADYCIGSNYIATNKPTCVRQRKTTSTLSNISTAAPINTNHISKINTIEAIYFYAISVETEKLQFSFVECLPNELVGQPIDLLK